MTRRPSAQSRRNRRAWPMWRTRPRRRGLSPKTAIIASVSGEAGWMPSWASSVSSSRSRPMPRAAALVADLEAPAADGARRRRPARHIGRAGAEDGHGAVPVAERALQRDQRHRSRRRLWLNGRMRFSCCRQVADIGAGKAKNALASAEISSGSCPAAMKACRAASTMLVRAPVEVGQDVGGAALAAAHDRAATLSPGLPCSSCRRHRFQGRNSRDILLRANNTNKIPIAKR